eukprot:1155052-Pelagomonas_calceolata.AAC.1
MFVSSTCAAQHTAPDKNLLRQRCELTRAWITSLIASTVGNSYKIAATFQYPQLTMEGLHAFNSNAACTFTQHA